ncbi:MAG: beta-lactamase family protein [Myxococcales bacterium]|nr:beta-lactamase family protein [Myxococcales bacterium]
MSDRRPLDELARAVVDDAVASFCAVGWAADRPGGGWAYEVGASGPEVSFFDLASVTKPMTALAVARAGLRDHPLGELVGEARGSPLEAATLELLLAHRAGLADHLPLFLPLVGGRAVDRSACLAEASRAVRPGLEGAVPPFAPVYSDLGYLLAGEALARHLGTRDAGEAIEELVVAPLGLSAELGTARALRAAGVDLGARAAPTEDAPWRGGVVRGAVHDENAWAISGMGGSGHAGMFGTAGALLRFAVAALEAIEDGAGPLGDGGPMPWLVEERDGGTLRAGFDGKSPAGSSAGELAGPRTFGHLGFTGTSLWIDPEARVAVTLLTNRVHPTRENTRIRAARPKVHDALFARAVGEDIGGSGRLP